MKRSKAKRERHENWIARRSQGRPALERAWVWREYVIMPTVYHPSEYSTVPFGTPAPGPAHDPDTAIEEADRVF